MVRSAFNAPTLTVRGRVGAGEAIGRAVDRALGVATATAVTEPEPRATSPDCRRRRVIAKANRRPAAPARAVAQRHRALADRHVVVADGDRAVGHIGRGGGCRAVAVGDVVGAAGEGAGAASIARIADRDRAVAISGVAGADRDSLAPACVCVGADGDGIGGARDWPSPAAIAFWAVALALLPSATEETPVPCAPEPAAREPKPLATA